jgi:hypothetical protein
MQIRYAIMHPRRDDGYATLSKDCRLPAPALVRSDECSWCAGAKRRQPRRKRFSDSSPLDLLRTQARTHIRMHTHTHTHARTRTRTHIRMHTHTHAQCLVCFRQGRRRLSPTDRRWMARRNWRAPLPRIGTDNLRANDAIYSFFTTGSVSALVTGAPASTVPTTAPTGTAAIYIRAAAAPTDRPAWPQAPERSLCCVRAAHASSRARCTLRVRAWCPERCDASVVEACACASACVRACMCACMRARVRACVCVWPVHAFVQPLKLP